MPFQAWDVIPHTQLYSMRSMGCAALQYTTQPQNRKGRWIIPNETVLHKEKNDYPTGYYHLQEYGYLFIFSTLLSIPFYCCSPIRNHGSQKTAPRSPSFISTSAGYMWKYTASTSYLLEDTKALFLGRKLSWRCQYVLCKQATITRLHAQFPLSKLEYH